MLLNTCAHHLKCSFLKARIILRKNRNITRAAAYTQYADRIQS